MRQELRNKKLSIEYRVGVCDRNTYITKSIQITNIVSIISVIPEINNVLYIER